MIITLWVSTFQSEYQSELLVGLQTYLWIHAFQHRRDDQWKTRGFSVVFIRSFSYRLGSVSTPIIENLEAPQRFPVTSLVLRKSIGAYRAG